MIVRRGYPVFFLLIRKKHDLSLFAHENVKCIDATLYRTRYHP